MKTIDPASIPASAALRSTLANAALRSILPAVALLLAAGAAGAQTPEPAGSWLGTLTVPGAQLRIVFHIERGSEGYTATMDSPDQGGFGIPVTAVTVSRDSVVLRLDAINGAFRGTLAGDTMTGSWAQGGMDFPLELMRTDAPTAPVRPQDPEPPFPYQVEEVRFTNEAAGIDLAGTLTTPRGEGPFPAALLISGSGPQDRDEAIMGHRPFLVLADHLTREGIAVLRVDDRGVGESEGDFAAATSADFATDVAAGVEYLTSRPGIDRNAIGLIGHSEGGLVAPMVANQTDDVAWLVLLAPPGVPGDSLLRLQVAAIGRAMGQDESAIAGQVAQQSELQRIVREAADSMEAERALRRALRESIADLSPAERAQAGLTPAAAVDSLVERSVRQVLSPWMRSFLAHDPGPELRQLEVPTLALLGELDLQVPPAQNEPALRRALEASHAPAWDVRVLPRLNHLFQHATTGAPMEYGQIEETFAPGAMSAIADWILKVTGR
ncbi:MAG: alpha/beta hydrolase family protein [Gemmatimonadota bacterium]